MQNTRLLWHEKQSRGDEPDLETFEHFYFLLHSVVRKKKIELSKDQQLHSVMMAIKIKI